MSSPLLPEKMSPYVSMDLETTGLKPATSLILEIGAVIDLDGIQDVDTLPTFRALIKHEKVFGDEYALNLNKLLIEESMDSGISIREAVEQFTNFLKLVPRKDPQDKVSFCGKNLPMFDFPFLRTITDIDPLVKHRVMDTGSLFYPYFGKVPSLGEINQLVFDTDKVAHTAVQDSINCINLFRWEFEFKNALLALALKGTPVPERFLFFMKKLRSSK